MLQNKLSVLALAGATFVAWNRARAGKFGDESSKITWLTVATLGFLLRQLFVKEKKPTKLITNVERAEESVEYDFIIVGGGTAGCVLAGRLSENPSVKVLVLEAGVSGQSLVFTRIPSAFSKLFHSRHVFNFFTQPQENAKGKPKYWPRAKMLGGCSAINAQMAQYGAPADFDEWSNIIKDDSWSWEKFRSYFTKFEKYVDDPAYPDVNSSVRGKDGPVRVGYFSYISEASKAYIKSCIKLGIQYSPDFNTTLGTRGVNRIMTYVDQNRTRVSAETAYLTDDVLARPNLKVILKAQVTKIITEKVGDELRTTGVEFAQQKDGPRFQIRCKREVILAAGAIHSPHILMLSGIGPAEELNKQSIPVVHDLAGVGQRLIDHPVVDVYFKNKFTSHKFLNMASPIDYLTYIGSTIRYLTTKRGAMATNWGEAAAFCRTDDPLLFPESAYPDKFHDSTSGDDSPDLELFSTPLAYKEHGLVTFPMHTFAVHVCLLRPVSRGTLTLKSSDPWDDPIMDPKYLSAEEDLKKLVRGVKLILRIAQVEPLASHLDHKDESPLLDHQLHLKSDKELEEVVRERLETLYHPAGTCRMAPLEDGGVVDAKLRVYGIQGLRVCDASIFPEIVSGHTAAACFASAEHLADMIKAELKALKAT